MISSTYRSRGMTVKTIPSSYSSDISIHIPLARYDITDASVWLQVRISIHIPLARYD